MTVSVVIATYNRGSKIATTLDSVLAQTRPVDEIVVIDDQSTDDTAAWIKAHYPAVRVLTYPNGGTSVARNRGAAAATGDVLVFLDHDDRMHPHAVETLLGMLAEFPEARAAHADHTLRDLTTGEYFPNHHTLMRSFHRLRAITPVKSSGTTRLYDRRLWGALLHGNLLQQPWAIRRQAFAEVGGFDPGIRYCEDWEMYIRVTSRFPVAMTDTVIADHLIEGGNLHRASGQEAQHMKVLRKHLAATRFRDLSTRRVLRMRLAMYHKAAGDEAKREGRTDDALSEYRSSLGYWPFDYMVAARCAAWTFSRLMGFGGRAPAKP